MSWKGRVASSKISAAARRIGFAAFVLLVSLILIEAILRAFFALRVGPSVLFYGTPWAGEVTSFDAPEPEESKGEWRGVRTFALHQGVEKSAWHADRYTEGYMKYEPNQVRVDFDPVTREKFDVSINRHGFRGEDYEIEKAPGVIRVISVGSSSTFGYFDRDHETYPYLLEVILNRRCAAPQTYEVINLGIPHSLVNHIRALLMKEGLALEPDIVTFYEGVNDSLTVARPSDSASQPEWLLSLRDRLVLVAFIDQIVDLRGVRFDEELFEERTRKLVGGYVMQLEGLRKESKRRGAHFILAAQQAKSARIASEDIRGITYHEEAEMIRERAEQGRVMSRNEVAFLAHVRLNERLRRWAEESGVTYVDTIAALDARRDVLMSWVHLNAEGNQMIAEALSAPILDLTCKVD